MQKEVRQIRKGEYKYPYRLELRLNETQMARLQSLASKSGLSMSAYVRQLIDGVLPQERPPLDFYKMLTELRYIGNNMNQLTRIAHATGRIDREKFERLTDEIKPLASMLYRYVTEPIKRDPMTSELGTYIRKSDQKALKENFGFWDTVQLTEKQEASLKAVYEKSFLNQEVKLEKSEYAQDEPIAAEAKRILDDIALVGWTSGGHSAVYVPVFAIGEGADIFQGRIDNTEIPFKIAEAAGYSHP